MVETVIVKQIRCDNGIFVEGNEVRIKTKDNPKREFIGTICGIYEGKIFIHEEINDEVKCDCCHDSHNRPIDVSEIEAMERV